MTTRVRTQRLIGGGLLTLVLAIATIIGCESGDPDTGSLNGSEFTITSREDLQMRINPSQVNIDTVGQVYLFRVQGGTPPYTWKVALPSNGNISGNASDQGNYTVSRVANNTVLVQDSQNRAARADITGGSTLKVTPSSATIEDLLGKVNFVVTGGSPPYTFNLTLTDIGTITAGGVYTRTGDGQQVVVIVDGSENSVSATISQPDDKPSLTINPSDATLGTNETAVVFLIEGGLEPYTWSLNGTPGPTLTPSGGLNTSAVFDRVSAATDGNNTVLVTDSAGQNVSAEVVMNQL